jgi:hypothetical protein
VYDYAFVAKVEAATTGANQHAVNQKLTVYKGHYDVVHNNPGHPKNPQRIKTAEHVKRILRAFLLTGKIDETIE